MKIIILVLLTLTQGICSEEKSVSAGFIIGIPTGINGKYWLSQKKAIVALVGWTSQREETITFAHIDYLEHNYEMLKSEELTGKIPFYYGVGIKFSSKKEEAIGLRIPLGIEYLFKDIPIDLFFEFAPALIIYKEITADLNCGIGIRYVFKGAF